MIVPSYNIVVQKIGLYLQLQLNGLIQLTRMHVHWFYEPHNSPISNTVITQAAAILNWLLFMHQTIITWLHILTLQDHHLSSLLIPPVGLSGPVCRFHV
jgi:hypothetical protein